LEKENTAPQAKQCLVCKATSDKKVLLCGEQNGKEVWVCTRCLPMLIHGAH